MAGANPRSQGGEGQSSAEGSVTSLVDNKVILIEHIFTTVTPFSHKCYVYCIARSFVILQLVNHSKSHSKLSENVFGGFARQLFAGFYPFLVAAYRWFQ